MNRAVGIDISKYQYPFSFSGIQKPCNFIIQRTSYGRVKDEKFDLLYPEAGKFRRKLAYHYYSTAVPWKEQAEFFLSIVDGKKFKKLVLDYEHFFNNLNEDTAADAFRWLEYVEAKSGVETLIYTNAYTYRDNLLAHGDWPELFRLWIARYYMFADEQNREPGMLGVRDQWTLWQYTDKGKGADYGCGSRYVDLNVFNGDVAQLDKWLDTEPPPIEPEPEPDCTKYTDAIDQIKGIVNGL